MLALLAIGLYQSSSLDYAMIQVALRSEAVAKKLQGDGRFVGVKFRSDSDDGGALCVSGVGG